LLVEAVRGTRITTRIYAPRLNVDELPPNVTWISRVIPHVEYREVLAGARIVVVPTRGVAYPGGQTVILEAMASGKAVIATRSPALAHYIDDGVTGVLSPLGDREALRETIQDLLGDPERRQRIAGAGLRSVQTRFNQRQMWATIAAHLHSLL
jgi:glycosyltransferase involved in cell wall biosynthesis